MATRHHRTTRPFRSPRPTLVALLGTGILLLGATGPATAIPTDPPSTSQEAEALWKDKEHEAAIAAEELSEAEMAVASADSALAAATLDLTNATAAATQAQQDADAAAAASTNAAQQAADYQVLIDSFVNASVNGGNPNSVSALMLADSAEDLLDRMAVLDQVAAASDRTLDEAVAAQNAAAVAESTAAGTRDTASRAAVQAAAAEVAAAEAATAATASRDAAATKKTEVDAAVAEFQALYYQLSAEERAAAAAEAAAAQQESDQLQAARTASTPTAQPSDAAATEAPVPAPFQVSGGSAVGQQAVQAALSRVGLPYVWGAAGPNSFDCSGLTSWAWAQAGVTIPRTSRGQSGLTTVPMDQLQPGDLITYYSPVSHVAMYIGEGQIVHASNSRQPVLVTTVDRGGPNPTAHRVG